ncbi:hypothetical protein [Streptomyces sp. NPDC102437]|uniref:hypothetical protein n=1 Tax=Streptomyces sp. NPDC102437 TaxID=3366175 RepID=UPI003825542C
MDGPDGVLIEPRALAVARQILSTETEPFLPADTVLDQGDTAGDTPPANGRHARTPATAGEPWCSLTSGDTARPHAEDTGDTTGDNRGDGVRFAYTARVRRGQVRHAITEAFELLDRELNSRPGTEKGQSHDA